MCAIMPGYAEVFDWHSDQKALKVCVVRGQQYVNVQNLPYMTEQEWSLGSTRLGVGPLIQETCLTSSKPSNPKVLTSQAILLRIISHLRLSPTAGLGKGQCLQAVL